VPAPQPEKPIPFSHRRSNPEKHFTFARYYVKGAGSTGFLEYRLAYRFSDGRKIGFTVVIPDFEIRNSSPFAGRCHIARRLRAALRELRNKMDMAAFTNKRIGTPWSP